MALKNDTYQKSIIKALYTEDTLSCTALSQRIGKSYSLVVKTLEDMLDTGLVQEQGYAESSGGRRSMTYSLPKGSFYTLAVAMDQFVTRICLYNAAREPIGAIHKLELLLEKETASSHHINNPGNNGKTSTTNTSSILITLTQFILEVLEHANSEYAIHSEQIIGIGIAMPGFIDARKGANYIFMGEGITDYIKEQTGIPVFIENDSTAIAMAEYHFGKVRQLLQTDRFNGNARMNALVINLSWGIGLGMIIDGQIFRGASGLAGEFSHIPLFKNGKLCSCGKTGCLETETSLLFMIEKAITEIQTGRATALSTSILQGKDYEQKSSHFLEAARHGDSLAIEIISDVAYNIGRGIAILIHLFNPDTIILSGRCSSCDTLWPPPIKRALNEFCIPRLLQYTTLEMSELNHSAELIGASLLVARHLPELNLPTAGISNSSAPKKEK